MEGNVLIATEPTGKGTRVSANGSLWKHKVQTESQGRLIQTAWTEGM